MKAVSIGWEFNCLMPAWQVVLNVKLEPRHQ